MLANHKHLPDVLHVPAEKNLHALKEILLDLPENVCLAFVGDGPSRPDLEKHFKGLKVVFMVSKLRRRAMFPLWKADDCILVSDLLVSNMRYGDTWRRGAC